MSRTFRFRWTQRHDPVSVEDYRDAARRALPDMIWAYIDHGAETESTLRANQAAFSRYGLRQRVLVGKTPSDLAVTVAGRRLGVPVLLAPTGLVGLAHWTGEVGAAQAAERVNTLSIVSTASSYSLEEVARATAQDHFFQLYPPGDATGIENLTLGLMDRAREHGYSAMFVTVDVQALGNRYAERKRGMGIPPTMTPARIADAAAHPRWCFNFLRHRRVSARNFVDAGGTKAAVRSALAHARLINPELNWDNLAWMRERWTGKLYVKGILDPADAARAVALGADGVVVSNHGGRQLDFADAAIDALPGIAAAVGDRGEVLVDGGIRRGSDVVKALCLGARAVCIGRPYLYGLAVAGPAGVEHVLKILHAEITRTLTLMGVTSLDELDPSWVVRRAVTAKA